MSHFEAFLDLLRGYSSLPCIYSGAETNTYAELLEEVDQWLARLDAIGIQNDTVIGLRADYSLSAVAILLALLSRNSVAAMIPRHGEIDCHLDDACVEWIIDLDGNGSYQWRPVARTIGHPLLCQLRMRREGGIIIFTSGSTGRPKASLHSLDRFLKKYLRPGRRFRTLAFLLLDHVAGLDTVFYTLANGGSLVLTRHRDPKSILKLIEASRVEVLPASPSFLRLVCAMNFQSEYDLSSLQIVTYGSEPMDPETLVRLNNAFPKVQIGQKYGTTEVGSPRTVSRSKDSLWLRIKSEDVETKVVDGVLWLRSQTTMLGYLNAPSPIDDQGWYCTGDLVDVDGEWVKFRGRASDTINVGGEKVEPLEIEQLILQLGFVRNVLVCGETHALLGQVVTAKVSLAEAGPSSKEAAQRIRLHCRQHLASYKIPVKIDIVFTGLTGDRQKAQRQPAFNSSHAAAGSESQRNGE